jgi:hypothetical protein
MSIAGEENNFPKTFKAGDLAISITANGLIDLKYKDAALLTVQNVWFMNEKWQALPRKDNDLLSAEVVGQSDAVVSLKIKDKREDFLKSFDEQVNLTKDSLNVVVDYEYSADIGQWHWPVYLFAQYFSGMKYKSVLADDSIKEGAISETFPDKVIYGLDGNVNLKEITFYLKDVDLKFTLPEKGWNFCDHRGAAWMKTKVFMMLNSSSAKKKDSKEHYELKISVTPKK